MNMKKMIGSLMVAGMILGSGASVLSVSASGTNDVRTAKSAKNVKTEKVAYLAEHFATTSLNKNKVQIDGLKDDGIGATIINIPKTIGDKSVEQIKKRCI